MVKNKVKNITISEKLFEDFCNNNKILFKRIAKSFIRGKKEPDYEVYNNSHQIIVEIKQYDPNSEEQRLQKQLEERGYTDSFGKEPGAKARLKIQAGAKQLKARCNGRNIPTLLVLYNNVPISNRGVDPYEIKTAMHGIEKIDLNQSLSNSSLEIVDRGFGPKRKMTPNCNTTISAIATLHCTDNGIGMHIFHNIYASTPLSVDTFKTAGARHFTIGSKSEGLFQDWQEIISEKCG